MDGVLCVDLPLGTVDGSKFFDFIRAELIYLFDGQNEHILYSFLTTVQYITFKRLKMLLELQAYWSSSYCHTVQT